MVLKSDKKLGTEGYRLTIGDVTTITASTVEGLVWGTRTILQLTEQNRSTGFVLPKGSTMDSPNYKLRGFMMDCGRKFIPMPYLRSLVKIMSYYKMNTLQIHLNDNGFKQFLGVIGQRHLQLSALSVILIQDLPQRMEAILKLSLSNCKISRTLWSQHYPGN